MMTDDEIKANLNKYFTVTGNVSIENGLVSCTGNVKLRHWQLVSKSPVQFKSVGGNFLCHDNQLTSLTGAPQSVGGNFLCHDNQLKSLAGAPRVVGGWFDCSGNRWLESLTGAPHLIDGKFYLTYADNLPLLPLLNISGVTEFVFWRHNEPTNQNLSVILTRWANTGTRGMVPCAMEMIKAGYRSNAKL
jgi:hypothetical protein